MSLLRCLLRKRESNLSEEKQIALTEDKKEIEVRSESDAIYKKITGFSQSEVALELIRSLANYYLQDPSNKDDSVKLGMQSLYELKPKNGIEGMLSAQMLATHDLAMELLKRAKASKHMDSHEKYLNGATKLLRTFTTQASVRNVNSGTKVEVQNVNVNDGGQAIVGSITKINK